MAKPRAEKASPAADAAKPKAAARDARLPREHRVVELGAIPELQEAAPALALGFKESRNVATHLIRQALMAFEWDAESKAWAKRVGRSEAAEAAGREALAAFDAAAERINADRAANAGKPRASSKELPAASSGPKQLRTLVLDATLLERACRSRPDDLRPDKLPAFGRLPFPIARAATKQAAQDFSNWLAAKRAWVEGAPIPRMPAYMREPSGFWMDRGDAGGLPKLGRLDLFADAEKTRPLATAARERWRDFDLEAALNAAFSKRWSKAEAPTADEAKLLRFVESFEGGSRVHRLQAVVALPRPEFPQGSFLAELSKRFARKTRRKVEEASKAARSSEIADALNLGRKALEPWIREIAKAQTWSDKVHKSANKKFTWVGRQFTACFVDPGVSNLAAMAFSSGRAGIVFSGKAFDRRMDHFERRIDDALSRATTKRAKDLQAKQARLMEAKAAAKAAARPGAELDEAAFRLPLGEHRELRSLLALAARAPKVQALRAKRKAFVKAQAHQLAAEIVKEAQGQKAALIVLGRSEGWKSGADLGSTQNRRLHRMPHSVLWTLVAEKSWSKGIAAIEVEESYTSQASFVHGDPLPVHPEQAKLAQRRKARAEKRSRAATANQTKAAPSKKAELTSVEDEAPCAPTAGASPSGVRGEGKSRGRFSFRVEPPRGSRPPSRPKPTGEAADADPSGERQANRLARRWPGDRGFGGLHADLNGAFNQGRKASPLFACHPKLSLAVEVRTWTSGSCPGWRRARPRASSRNSNLDFGAGVGAPLSLVEHS